MTEQQSGGQRRTKTIRQDEAQDVAAFCARPSCRQEYRRVTQPGRRQAYCSPICRRAAEKEIRQLRARLTHFESVVEQARIDLAAHGRTDDEGDPSSSDPTMTASKAVARAGGVLRFVGSSEDPLADELRALHDAVLPLVGLD
jgi:hypothetical protein